MYIYIYVYIYIYIYIYVCIYIYIYIYIVLLDIISELIEACSHPPKHFAFLVTAGHSILINTSTNTNSNNNTELIIS